MKRVLARTMGLVGIVALALIALWWLKVTSVPKQEHEEPAPSMAPQAPAPEGDLTTQRPYAGPQGNSKRWAEMAEKERAELAEKFKAKFKPAVERWALAYEQRIPFKAEDVTLEKFHSRLGDNLYTFMIDDTTVTVRDSTGGAWVFYVMTREAARELNELPGAQFTPNLNVPVTREEIIRMIKADAAVSFEPHEIRIKPTAAACALNGGAFVDAGGEGGNGMFKSFSGVSLSFVFGADGRLVYYLRGGP